MKSMTGYGRSEIIENSSKISVEIKTVNNRFLDINCRMPKSSSIEMGFANFMIL